MNKGHIKNIDTHTHMQWEWEWVQERNRQQTELLESGYGEAIETFTFILFPLKWHRFDDSTYLSMHFVRICVHNHNNTAINIVEINCTHFEWHYIYLMDFKVRLNKCLWNFGNLFQRVNFYDEKLKWLNSMINSQFFSPKVIELAPNNNWRLIQSNKSSRQDWFVWVNLKISSIFSRWCGMQVHTLYKQKWCVCATTLLAVDQPSSIVLHFNFVIFSLFRIPSG